MKHQSQQKKGKLASRKHLSADPLFKRLHKDFLGVSDHREGDPDISMADALCATTITLTHRRQLHLPILDDNYKTSSRLKS